MFFFIDFPSRFYGVESLKHSNHIDILSLRCSLFHEETEPCVSEAILTVLMVCIIHVDESNRNSKSTYGAISFHPSTYRVSAAVKNSHPSPSGKRAMEKLLPYRNAIPSISYVYVDTYHKPRSRHQFPNQ